VGETLAQRDGGQTDDVVTVQLCMALEGVAELQAERLIVAYEPVWAIGTGRPCDDLEAARVCGLIRDLLVGTCGARSADSARVLYGGSVKAENAGAYFAHASVDGALVGGASLDATSFAAIARAAAVGTGA
jgi:triosephosphate isomerase